MQARSHRANVLFNLMGGFCTGLMLLVLPYLLNRLLSQSEYAVWALGYQIAIYIPMFGLGIHQLLNRAIANDLSQNQPIRLQRNISSAFWIVAALGSIAFMCVLLSSQYISRLLQIDPSDEIQIRNIWMYVGGAASMGLFALFFFGYFGGQQRYEWENIYKAIISIGLLVLVYMASLVQVSITPIMIGQLYALTIALGLGFLVWVFCKEGQHALPSWKNTDLANVRSYLFGMYGLTIWQLGNLMVSGFDIWIVARFDFLAVPGYSIALSFLTFISGAVAAIIGPCLPIFSADLARSARSQFKETFLYHQKRLLFICFFIFLGLMMIPDDFWHFLLKDSAYHFTQVFTILLIATCIRIMTMLYSLAVVSANLQTKIVLSPLLEGVVNVVFSIVLGFYLGPVGVAYGTLIGALICLLFHTFYNIPRLQKEIPLYRSALIFPWINSK